MPNEAGCHLIAARHAVNMLRVVRRRLLILLLAVVAAIQVQVLTSIRESQLLVLPKSARIAIE
jgi:hypothetical protein